MGGSAKAGPVVSDNNNFIVDAQFTPRAFASCTILPEARTDGLQDECSFPVIFLKS